MKCVVVGLGQFGKTAAVGLARSEHDVMVIDKNQAEIESIKDDVSLAICGDGTSLALLEAHQVEQADVFIAAICENFESQILSVVQAKRLGIKTIVARAEDPDHQNVLMAVGATVVILPEDDAGQQLVQRLTLPDVQKYFEIESGFAIVELEVPSVLIGRQLHEVGLRTEYGLNLVGIRRREKTAELEHTGTFDPIPDPELEFKPGDTLYLSGSEFDIARFMSIAGQDR